MENTDTRQYIFDTALDMFAKDGYQKVSVRHIADKIGIQAPSIYYYFKSKEVLLDAIFDYYEKNRNKFYPSLEKLLNDIETQEPSEVLRKSMVEYPREIKSNMQKALLVANSLNQANKRADKILDELMNTVFEYDIQLLTKMIELNLIESLDINRFAAVHASFFYCAAIRYYRYTKKDYSEYSAGLDFIFQLVKPKE